MSRPNRGASWSRASWFQSAIGGNCQNTAAAVWSAVRVVLSMAPSDFTSAKSFSYARLVSSFGPFVRNCHGVSIEERLLVRDPGVGVERAGRG